MTSSSPSGVHYRLTFVNHSSKSWTVCLYQTDAAGTIPNLQSLAWFAESAAPGTSVAFDWTIEYGFVWSQTGPLTPGVVFGTSQQHLPANLSTANRVTFSPAPAAAGQEFTFTNQTAGPHEGSLYIHEDHGVAANRASVGIAMSGAGVFAVQAQPDVDLIFTPHPTYWITIGQFVPGQVLDIDAITNSMQIDFPPGVYAMTATLNRDESWTVSPS